MKNTLKIIRHQKIEDQLIKDWEVLWEKAENANINNSYEWFLMHYENSNDKKIVIYTCYEQQELVGIFPFIENQYFGIPTMTTPGSNISFNTPFLVRNITSDILEPVFEQITKDFDNLFIPKIDTKETEILHNLFPKIFFHLMSANPFIDLTENPFQFLSKSSLKGIDRVLKKHKHNLSIKYYDQHSDLNNHLETIFYIDQNSGKKQKSRDIFSKKENREVFQNFVKYCKRYIKICFLYYKDIPIAYDFIFTYKQTFLDYQTSYLLEYNQLSPGKIILYSMLKGLNKHEFKLFDLCGGLSNFKQKFTQTYYLQYNLFYSNKKLIMLHWRLINTARRIKQILLPEKHTRDHEFLFKEFNAKAL